MSTVSYYSSKDNIGIHIHPKVAASSLFVWDYLLTLGMEIELIWYSPWTIMKVLYILQRYMPFIDGVILTLHCEYLPLFSRPRCHSLYETAEHVKNPSARYCRVLYLVSGCKSSFAYLYFFWSENSFTGAVLAVFGIGVSEGIDVNLSSSVRHSKHRHSHFKHSRMGCMGEK